MKIPKFVNVFKIQINYKSGISVIGNYMKFDGVMNGNEVTSLEWLLPGGGIRPIFMNVSAIESIYQLGVKKRLCWVEL